MLLESLQAIESIIIANIRLLCSTNRLCNLYLIYLKDKYRYTANVYRELHGVYREIGVQGFQIYGDCMYTRNPCNL